MYICVCVVAQLSFVRIVPDHSPISGALFMYAIYGYRTINEPDSTSKDDTKRESERERERGKEKERERAVRYIIFPSGQ